MSRHLADFSVRNGAHLHAYYPLEAVIDEVSAVDAAVKVVHYCHDGNLTTYVLTVQVLTLRRHGNYNHE